MPYKLHYAFYLNKKQTNKQKTQVGFGILFWFYSLSESNLKPMKGVIWFVFHFLLYLPQKQGAVLGVSSL